MFKSPVSIATQWIRGLFLLPWHYRGIINRYLGRFGLLGTVWSRQDLCAKLFAGSG